MNKKVKRAGEEEDEETIAVFPVTYIPSKAATIVFNLYGLIVSPLQFHEFITVLGSLEEDSEVIINLQSPGGSVDATDCLIHALRRTKASVHVVATGGVHSAGTCILLEADSFELSDNFSSLIHCGSLGDGGTLSEFTMAAPFKAKLMERFIRNTYEGFLTEKEIDEVIAGKDMWIDAYEWVDRHEMRSEYFRKKIEEMNKPPKKPRARKSKPVVE